MTLMPTDDNLEPEQNKGKQAKILEEILNIDCFRFKFNMMWISHSMKSIFSDLYQPSNPEIQLQGVPKKMHQ